MKDNKFFSFFEPVLKYIDTGKFFREPFRWLYAILAILNLLTPIVLLVMAINNDLFRYGGGRMIAAIFLNGDASMLRMMGTGAFFGSGSLIYIVLNPIYGFIIVVVTRAVAETFRALAAIANNTKKS